MKLIASSHFPFGAYGLEKVGIVVERACQLMGVALIDIRLHIVVPRISLITVQRVAAANPDAVEESVFLDEPCDFLEVCLSALSPRSVVRLVERKDAHDVHPHGLRKFHTRLDHLVPFLRLAIIVGGIERLMVTVEHHILHTGKLDVVDS